jgi:translocation and assembly module TamB
MTKSPDKPPRKKLALHWRIARHTVASLLLLVLLVVIAALLIFRNLDTSWIKTRLRNIVAAEAGLELDYETAQVDVFSGIILKNFAVAQPPELRAVAPELMHAGMITLGWSLFGKGPMLRHFVANDVTFTILVDDDGRTSLDTLGGKKEAKKEATTPGKQLVSVLRAIPDFDRLQFSPLTVEVLQSHEGKIRRRTELTGLDLRMVSTGLDVARAVEISLGDKQHPLAVELRRDDGSIAKPLPPPPPHKKGEKRPKLHATLPPEAEGTLFVDARLTAADAHLAAELVVKQQTLDAEWPKKGVFLAVDAQAKADGDALNVALERFEALVEAVVAKGALVVAPERARIDAASGTVDLTRLAKLVPAARLPLTLREGHTKYDVAGLDLDPAPRLDPGGHLDVDMHASGLRAGGEACLPSASQPPAPGCAALGRTTLDLDGVRFSLKGRPLPTGGVQLDAALPAAAMTLAVEHGARVQLTHADTTVVATLPSGAAGHIDVRTRFDSLSTGGRLRGANAQLSATGGVIDTRLSELLLDKKVPAQSSGALATSLTLGSLTTLARGVTSRSDNLSIAVRARVAKGEPTGVELDSKIGSFTAKNAGGVLVPPGPAQLAARVEKIVLDRAVPLFSQAHVKLDAAIGGITLGTTLDKLRDAVTYDFSVAAERAALLTAFAPPAFGLSPKMGFALHSKGRVDDLLAPRVKQSGSLRLERATVTIGGETLAADAFDLAGDSDGNARRLTLALTLRPTHLQLDDEKLGDGTLTLAGKWDAARPAFELTVDGAGKALPAGHLAASLSWDKSARAIVYAIDGNLANLAALTPLLPASLTDEHWLDLSDLAAKITSHGRLSGVVLGFDRDDRPILSKNILATLRGDDDLRLEVAHFHYVDARGVELTLPSLTLATKVKSDGRRHHGEAELRVGSATLTTQKRQTSNKIALTALVDNLTVDLDGDPRSGPIDVVHHLTLGKLVQDAFAGYPTGNLTQETHARRTADGSLQLDRFELTNGDGGTKLSAHGGLTLGRAIVRKDTIGVAEPIGFSSLGLDVTITQALAKLASPGKFIGSGSATVTAELMSGDLRRFHATVATRFDKASFALPAHQFSVENIDGTLPVVEDFVLEKGKPPRLFHAGAGNAYPQLRFSDQHPFLSGSGALSIAKITVGDIDLTDVAGNLRVMRDQLAIDQLDAGMRGGRIAGQMLIDWRGADSTAQLRLRMTGIEARHKGARERFDGNLALNVSLRERDVDGRIEILRIGRQHLYDLLDEVDAHHKDAAINRVRSALELGYPDHVQVVFDRGFASMQVTFGGLARLLKVHEVHGIPVGPLVERYLGPLLSLESP